jgi:hypothetical protein
MAHLPDRRFSMTVDSDSGLDNSWRKHRCDAMPFYLLMNDETEDAEYANSTWASQSAAEHYPPPPPIVLSCPW